jgi:NhaP-type Na+/H+ or K+/H+ antiporter
LIGKLTFESCLWIASGFLMLLGLSSALVRRLPISTAALYFLLGLALGPWGFDVLSAKAAPQTKWFERATELGVIISLFVGGLKLRQPLRSDRWLTALRLAGPVMLLSIVFVAVLCRFILDLSWTRSLLIGAILAPTDPVLASAVSVGRATDDDRVRFGLSGEAGLNDGMAFPFIVLALQLDQEHGFGGWTAGWAMERLVWAIPAGLMLGFWLGRLIGRLAVSLRSQQRDVDAPSDFLALALIALSYVAAESVGAWGFLATFAAGVGLRSAEMRIVRKTPHPDVPSRSHDTTDNAHPPAEDLVPATVQGERLTEPAEAAGVLVAETLAFGRIAERVVEMTLVVLMGVMLASHWDVRALPLAALLFVVIRPLATQLSLVGTPTSGAQRWMIGWFGVRGVGSLYYLSYSLHHGLVGADATLSMDITISVITLSIVAHGITAQPLLQRYEKAWKRWRRSPSVH